MSSLWIFTDGNTSSQPYQGVSMSNQAIQKPDWNQEIDSSHSNVSSGHSAKPWAVVATFDLKEGHGTEWIQIVEEVVDAMKYEKTFISTSVCAHPTEPGKFVLFEVWKDRGEFFTIQVNRDYRRTLMERLPTLIQAPVIFEEWDAEQEWSQKTDVNSSAYGKESPSAKPWVVVVKLDIKEECVPEFRLLARTQINAMALEETFLSSTMCVSPTDPGKFLLFEVWKSREQFFTTQVKRDYSRSYLERLAALVRAPVVVEEWNEVRADSATYKRR